MKIYLASIFLVVFLKYRTLFPGRKLNLLRSFGLLDEEMSSFLKTHRDKIESVILDSGTWTLNKSKIVARKEKINLKTYKDYAETFGDEFDFYFNFDSNFTEEGHEENLSNQIMLEEAGLKPVPVIHDIYNEEIDYYIDRGHMMLALGSTQLTNNNHLIHVMRKVEGTGVKLHIFGNTKFSFLADFPIYSCDTASWAHKGSFGDILYWNPKKEGENKTDRIYLEEYMHADKKKRILFSDYEYREDLEIYLSENFGFTWEDFLIPNKGSYNKMVFNTHYYTILEEEINKIHRRKGFIAEVNVES